MIDREKLRSGRQRISRELATARDPVDVFVEAEVQIVENYRKRGTVKRRPVPGAPETERQGRYFEVWADEYTRGHGGTDTAPGPLEYFLMGAAF